MNLVKATAESERIDLKESITHHKMRNTSKKPQSETIHTATIKGVLEGTSANQITMNLLYLATVSSSAYPSAILIPEKVTKCKEKLIFQNNSYI